MGANGGLGREITAALTRRGATVVRCTRSGGPDNDVTLDLRDARAGDALLEHVGRTHGRLDGVVVAAGIVAFGDLVDTDDVVIEELFLTNAMGPMWLAMCKKHGWTPEVEADGTTIPPSAARLAPPEAGASSIARPIASSSRA